MPKKPINRSFVFGPTECDGNNFRHKWVLKNDQSDGCGWVWIVEEGTDRIICSTRAIYICGTITFNDGTKCMCESDKYNKAYEEMEKMVTAHNAIIGILMNH